MLQSSININYIFAPPFPIIYEASEEDIRYKLVNLPNYFYIYTQHIRKL